MSKPLWSELDEHINILRRICARGRSLFLANEDSIGVDMFEHMENEVNLLANVVSTLENQAAALPAVPEGESVTLTVAQIADLARFAGLTLAQPPQPTADELEATITVCECPEAGVLLDGEDADPGVAAHYTHIAYYSEYPDEGCIGLGPEIAATPKDQP